MPETCCFELWHPAHPDLGSCHYVRCTDGTRDMVVPAGAKAPWFFEALSYGAIVHQDANGTRLLSLGRSGALEVIENLMEQGWRLTPKT